MFFWKLSHLLPVGVLIEVKCKKILAAVTLKIASSIWIVNFMVIVIVASTQ